MKAKLPVHEDVAARGQRPVSGLTAVEFRHLATVPPEVEWYANLTNPRTRRAYQSDLADFLGFAGIREAAGLRRVTRAHVIAWRLDLEARGLAAATVCRRLAALSGLCEHLCDAGAIESNPTRGVRRPKGGSREGKTPAISDRQARALLDAPAAETLQGKRDRAVLATLLCHGLRRAEVCGLRVGDLRERGGVIHLRVRGKGEKLRHVPAHPEALGRINAYLDAAGHGDDLDGPLFRPLKNPLGGTVERALCGTTLYRRIVRRYARQVGISVPGLCVHSLRATAATNALERGAEITKVQDWLGHAHIATTRLYDRRHSQPEDSPTFRVAY